MSFQQAWQIYDKFVAFLRFASLMSQVNQSDQCSFPLGFRKPMHRSRWMKLPRFLKGTSFVEVPRGEVLEVPVKDESF